MKSFILRLLYLNFWFDKLFIINYLSQDLIMKFSIGFLKTANLIHLKEFDLRSHELNQKIIDISDVETENFQLIITDDFSNLKSIEKTTTLLTPQSLNLTYEIFENQKVEAGINFYKPLLQKMLLKNNLNTVSEIFELTTHLKNYWSKDRYAFFHEVWYFAKKNFGAIETKIYFHDVIEKKDEHDKDKLIITCLDAKNKPDLRKPTSAEEALYKKYENTLTSNFEVIENFTDRGEIFISAQINKSPIMMMMKVLEFNQLQETLFKTILKSLVN